MMDWANSLARGGTGTHSLPQGYDSVLGEQGARLSGGQRQRQRQRQRIAIARTQRQVAQVREEFDRDRLLELTEAEEKVGQLTEELKKATQRQSLQRLMAPVAGTVQQLQLHTIGGVVEPAKPLLVIVPEDAGIEIEAEIENKDIGFVEEGQEAAVKLDAFPFTRYGTLTGHVVTISDDAVEQQSSTRQPPRLIYSTRVRLEKDTMLVDGRMVHLLPGMAAAVEIKTGARTLIEFVLSPLLKMGGEAGRQGGRGDVYAICYETVWSRWCCAL